VKILGHSILQQTGEYIDVSRGAIEEALARLSDIYTARWRTTPSSLGRGPNARVPSRDIRP